MCKASGVICFQMFSCAWNCKMLFITLFNLITIIIDTLVCSAHSFAIYCYSSSYLTTVADAMNVLHIHRKIKKDKGCSITFVIVIVCLLAALTGWLSTCIFIDWWDHFQMDLNQMPASAMDVYMTYMGNLFFSSAYLLIKEQLSKSTSMACYGCNALCLWFKILTGWYFDIHI